MTKRWLGVLIGFVCSVTLIQAEARRPAPSPQPILLVMDIQNDFLPYMDAQECPRVMRAIPAAIELFHRLGLPVIHVYHTDPKRGPDPALRGFQFPDTIPIAKNDIRVIKNHPSAFEQTELEKILREKGCSTLYICGLSMTGCVGATCRNAMALNMNPIIIAGLVTSHDARLTQKAHAACHAIQFLELEKNLKPLH